MARCLRVAPLLLTHLNVLLAMFAGGALVTAARLKWDPSTYVALRIVFPVEYRVLAGVLTGAGGALLVLVHLAIAALAVRRASVRRVLLFVYAALMCVLAAAELAWCGWMVHRLLAWLNTAQAAHILEVLRLRNQLKTIVNVLDPFFSLPKKIKHLMEEVEEDVPRNLYTVAAGGVVLAVVHALAVLVALALAACTPGARGRRLSHSSWVTTSTSVTGSSSEKAPLRTAYKNGRIVIL